MAENKLVVQCYAFPNGKEYEKAKKEQETIAYIKANTDLANIKVVAKLYVSLIEKRTFDTVVGYAFLGELRDTLLAQNIVTEDSLPPIPVKSASNMSKESVANDRAERYKELYKKTNNKKKISIYANIILVIMIIVMMVLALMTQSKANNPSETELIDKYSSWKQELEQKEDELNQREQDLNQSQDVEK